MWLSLTVPWRKLTNPLPYWWFPLRHNYLGRRGLCKLLLMSLKAWKLKSFSCVLSLLKPWLPPVSTWVGPFVWFIDTFMVSRPGTSCTDWLRRVRMPLRCNFFYKENISDMKNPCDRPKPNMSFRGAKLCINRPFNIFRCFEKSCFASPVLFYFCQIAASGLR